MGGQEPAVKLCAKHPLLTMEIALGIAAHRPESRHRNMVRELQSISAREGRLTGEGEGVTRGGDRAPLSLKRDGHGPEGIRTMRTKPRVVDGTVDFLADAHRIERHRHDRPDDDRGDLGVRKVGGK